MTAKKPFDGFDFEGFWKDSPYSLENYVEPPPSDRLPAAYVDLARRHLVKRTCHPMKERTGWGWLSPASTQSAARPNICSPGYWAPSS